MLGNYTNNAQISIRGKISFPCKNIYSANSIPYIQIHTDTCVYNCIIVNYEVNVVYVVNWQSINM